MPDSFDFALSLAYCYSHAIIVMEENLLNSVASDPLLKASLDLLLVGETSFIVYSQLLNFV